MVHESSVPLFWRLKRARYSLIGSRCKACHKVYFPPKNFCPDCRRKGRIEDHQLSGKGKIVSYTVIRVPPEGFESPYAVAIIELEEGTNISGQIVGNPDEVGIGKRVSPVFRKISQDGSSGLIQYGMKWEIESANR
jgi:uncharacterized OB-fold protein